MNIYWISVIFCVVFLGVTIELIRRRKIAEQYAILWLVLGFVMLLFSAFPGLLKLVSRTVHIYYAPSLLFFLGLVFLLAIVMHFTIVLSRLQRKLTRLVQEVALLRAKRQEEEADHDDSAHRVH